MEYKDFLEILVEKLEEILGSEYSVHQSTVMKNNGKLLDTIVILCKGERAAPVIYPVQYFQMLKEGAALPEIVRQVLGFYQENRLPSDIEIGCLSDFSYVRDKVVCRLVNCEKNSDILECVPHRYFLDLAVVFYFNMEHEFLGKGSVRIQKSHLKMWGITEEEVVQAAEANAFQYRCPVFKPVSELIEEMTGVSVEETSVPMYVLTNEEKYCGAVLMMEDAVLKQIALELEDDFYILPSSIHECMVLPVHNGSGMTEVDLRNMVCEINQLHVAEDEILGDSIYRYSLEEGELEIVSGIQKWLQ